MLGPACAPFTVPPMLDKLRNNISNDGASSPSVPSSVRGARADKRPQRPKFASLSSSALQPIPRYSPFPSGVKIILGERVTGIDDGGK